MDRYSFDAEEIPETHLQKLSRLTFEVEQLNSDIAASADTDDTSSTQVEAGSKTATAISYTQMLDQVLIYRIFHANFI